MAGFIGSQPTSDDGVLHLQKTEKLVAVISTLSRSTRQQSDTMHSLNALLSQRIFGSLCMNNPGSKIFLRVYRSPMYLRGKVTQIIF